MGEVKNLRSIADDDQLPYTNLPQNQTQAYLDPESLSPRPRARPRLSRTLARIDPTTLCSPTRIPSAKSLAKYLLPGNLGVLHHAPPQRAYQACPQALRAQRGGSPPCVAEVLPNAQNILVGGLQDPPPPTQILCRENIILPKSIATDP